MEDDASTQSALYLSILPWLDYYQTIDFCGYSIWDFYKEGPERIGSTKDMLYLAQFFSCIKDKQGNDSRSIFIARLVNERPSVEDIQLCSWMVRALAFCFAFSHSLGCIRDPNIARHATFESERFQLNHYTIKDEMLYYFQGSVSGATTCAGKHFRLYEPEFMWVGSSAHPHPQLKDIFEAYFFKEQQTEFQSELWQRITLALDWYYSALSGSPEVKPQSRVIMMETAFEALIRESNDERRSALCNRADNICKWKRLRKVSGSNKSVAYEWLNDFIDGRNSFVHGGRGGNFAWNINTATRMFSTADVATIVLADLILGLLEKEGHFKQRNSMIRSNINAAYREIGWMPEPKVSPTP